MTSQVNACLVCAHPSQYGIFPFHFKCTTCGCETYQGERSDVRYSLLNRTPVLANVYANLVREGLGNRVLDVGCGDGQLVALLRRDGVEAWGIDISLEQIRVAEATVGEFFCAKTTCQIRDRFDSILYIDSIEHFWDPVEELKRARALLKPGGSIFLYLPGVENALYRTFCAMHKVGFPRHLMAYWALASPYPHRALVSDRGLKLMANAADLTCEINAATRFGKLAHIPTQPRSKYITALYPWRFCRLRVSGQLADTSSRQPSS